MAYDGTKPGATKLKPGTINRLDGDLFTVTFENAAVLPDGTRADLVVTYSNARIVVDQRYASAPEGEQYYHGAVYLAQGNAVSYGGTDSTNFENVAYASKAQEEVYKITHGYGQGFTNSNCKTPSTGLTIDIAYNIVKKDGTLASGTFVYAVCGVNLDRDPGTGSKNNVGKPLWYSYKDNFDGENGIKYSFFSEAMEIRGGQISENVYLRPNSDREDNPDKVHGIKGSYYHSYVSRTKGSYADSPAATQPAEVTETTETCNGQKVYKDANGKKYVRVNEAYHEVISADNLKFIGNALGEPDVGGNDNSYNSGFVTLADAATGLRVTATGHGNADKSMNSKFFNSKQIWYRYTSGSGPHGRIETTSEGNWGGNLDKGTVLDGGTLSKPDTYVVAEGKTVTYTMTPDIGYKLSKLTVNGAEVKYDKEAVSKMKKGDSVEVETAAGNKGTLTYREDGTYTFVFEYAKSAEEIKVEWERTTADLLVSKVWNDEDDKDGMRSLAYRNDSTTPRFKLQQSTNGGRTWTDVTKNARDKDIKSQVIPDGKDTSGKYKDGTFAKNNDTTKKHPFTWEYLPVYTYDSNGTADRLITYRIVELPQNPPIDDYKRAQYFDTEEFELSSEMNKSWEGWQIYKDTTTDKTYAYRGDGKYYEVNSDGHITAAAAEPDPKKLTPVESDKYRTVDKALPYQEIDVRNEHDPKDIFVEVEKEWNDKELNGLVPAGGGANEYERKKIKFVLHGETDEGTVDLNGSADGNERIIATDEAKAKYVKIDNFQIYKASDGKQYAQVTGHGTYPDGFYIVENGAINYSAGIQDVSGDELEKLVNETYKTDDDRFGAYFDDLPTHDGGRPITYSVTEKFEIGGEWLDAGTSDVAWTTTGGKLIPVRDSSNEIIGYETEFINTPNLENVYETLPLTIIKRDSITQGTLEGAEFTVYLDAVSGDKPLDDSDTKVEGQQIYTDGTTEYVVRKDPQDQNKEKFYTFSADGQGGYSYTLADPQPEADKISKKASQVRSKVVTTGTSGSATIEFLEPGTYDIVETGAPEGYTADTTIYRFEVKRDLKSIKLKSAEDPVHPTKWWEKLFNLLFGTVKPDNAEWKKDLTTLYVDDKPLDANVLVRKYWNDNDDQDGVRPDDRPDDDDETNMPKVILQWTTGAHTATGHPVYASGGKKYIHNQTDNKYYEVTEEDTQGSFDTQAAEPQPVDPSVTDKTCQGRKVYASGDNKYVYVDGAYHKVTEVDKEGKVASDPAENQPAESDLTLVMDGEWANVQIDSETTPGEKVDAKAKVSYAGGPVLTHQHDAYTWNDIPAYRDGKPVTYRVFETSSLLNDGTYMIEYSHTSDKYEKVFTLINHSAQTISTHNQTVDVMNKHATRIINIKAYKIWNDDDSSKRSESVLRLYKTVNGATSVVTKTVGGRTIEDTGTVPVVSTTEPVKIWSDLPVYEGGYPITYRIEEESIDGYKTVYELEYTKGDEAGKKIKKKSDNVDASDVKRTFDASGNENTTAKFTVENEQTIDIKVDKTWVDGANANVTYELWRTTTKEEDLTDSKFKKITICYQHKDNHSRISIQDYNDLPGKEKNNYTEVEGQTWSPYSSADPAVPVDGWEKVTAHEFPAAIFENSSSGDTKSYPFEDMPRQEAKIIEGQTVYSQYLYRILETPKLVRFAADQTSNSEVKNYNVHASRGVANIEAIKELDGRKWKNGERFYFELKPDSATDKTDSSHQIEVSDIPLPMRMLNDRPVYEDGNNKKYVIDADGWYREVLDGNEIAGMPAKPQPENLTVTSKKISGWIKYPIGYTGDIEAGTHGRYVNFKNLEIGSEKLVPRGHTVELNYDVYEVYDALGTSIDEATRGTGIKDGISYDGRDPLIGSFSPKVHKLKVVVTNDLDGRMTTAVYWDGSDREGGTPTYTNTYEATEKFYGHIIKHISGREFKKQLFGSNDDAFIINVINMPGSVVRVNENEPASTDPVETNAVTIKNNNDSRKVTPNGSSYDPVEGLGGTYRAVRTDHYGAVKSSDLAHYNSEGKATDTFIYEFHEHDSSTSYDNDLILDTGRIYMKVVVTDNQDGTLDIQRSYWRDATCKDKPVQSKVLVDSEEDIAPAGAKSTDTDNHGKLLYHYIEAAYFDNLETVDIPVKKEWTGGPAIEDVTLHLKQHLFPLTGTGAINENSLDYKFVESQKKAWESSHDETDPFWVAEGYVYTAKRGDFLNEDGTPKYNDPDLQKTSSKTYGGSNDFIEGFNKDLPKYVMIDGVKYRAVYMLEEDNTSDAYTTTYRSIKDSSSTDGNNIYIDGETLIVNNTVKATNTAAIAIVKQLLGRQWLATDEFTFDLKPLGIGKYKKDGSFDSIDDSQEAKEKVPMPVSYRNNETGKVISASEYEELSDAEKAKYTIRKTDTAKAVASGTTVDQNGGLERLARFDEIVFTINDLTYDDKDGHMQGDFFYKMKEMIPADAENADGIKYEDATPEQKAAGGFKKDGITYDGDDHTVHVKVRENRTGKLQVQIAYDEEDDGNIKTGTQFTPVCTNKYSAATTVKAGINKYIMGRDWKSSDQFDFKMMPLAGAPFKDADKSNFPETDTKTDDERKAALAAGKAVHDKEGAHVKRLKVSDVSLTTQTMDMPAIIISYEDLNKTTVAGTGDKEGQSVDDEGNVIKYKDGNAVPAGTSYGRFVYALEETEYFRKAGADLNADQDTEYVRVTVIDRGNGTLDKHIEIFEDRYCRVHHYMRVEKPDERDLDKYYEYDSLKKEYTKAVAPFDASKTYYEEAKSTAFVNQLKRDLTAVKAWAGSPTTDVTLRLQWSVNEENWYNVDGTAWMPNVEGTKTITKKDAEAGKLSVTWTDLPAYANINLYNDMTGESGDDIALNDKWIFYQVVEEQPEGVDLRYNDRAYAEGDNINTTIDGRAKYVTKPYHTGSEKTESGSYVPEDKRVRTLYVTNFPKVNEKKAKFGVVKQYIGKEWEDEKFTFVVIPKESKLGDAGGYTENGKEYYAKKGQKVGKISDEDFASLAVLITEKEYKDLTTIEQNQYNSVTNRMPVPAEKENTATASAATDAVSVNEHAANFEGITFRSSDLKRSKDGKDKGEFIYTIKEKIPEDAVPIYDGDKITYYVTDDENGNKIKYTAAEHTVKFVVTDSGSDDLDITVSYDDRKAGEFVPVYVNFAMKLTPVTGTKKWVGGSDTEHVNGTVKLNDNNTEIISSTDKLGLKLQRKPDKKNAEPKDVINDDAGRPLEIVWVEETRTTKEVETGNYVNKNDSTDVISAEEYNAMTPEERANYKKETVIVTTISYEKQEGKDDKGTYTYTVKAKDSNKYVDPVLNTSDDDGNKYIYSVVEGNVPAGYDVSYNGMDVTNTRASGSTKVVVSKKWDDADDQDGKRPESVEVSIKAEGWDGKDLHNKQVGNITLDDSNNWKSVFKDLPEKNKAGKKYDYTISEDTASLPKGYDATVRYQSLGDKNWSTTKPEDWNGKVLVTNSYTPGKLNIKATKVWEGETDEVGTSLRSDVILHLYGKDDSNGLVVYDAGTKKISKDASEDERTVTWKDIPKRHYKNEDLSWEVTEEPVFGYTTKITGDFTEGFVVTNTYSEPVTKVTAKKVWDDDNVWEDKAYTKRPEKVTFELWRKVGDSDPEQVSGSDKTVSKDTTKPWTAEWNNLPVVKKVELESETEKERTEYKTVKKQKTNDEGNLIFKKLDTGEEVTVSKEDAEAENSEYQDPENYKPVMIEEEVPVKETEKAKETKEVPVFYMVKEAKIDDPHYADPVYTVTEPGKFRVINSFIKETINIPVKKIWIDNGDTSGLRPDHITLNLIDRTHNDKIVRQAELSSEDKTSEDIWEHTFMGVPKYDENGAEIVYEVTEKKVPAYETEVVKDGEGGYIITNTHNVGAKTSLTVTKKWEGDEADKSDRTSVQVQLIEVVEGAKKEVGDPVTLEFDKSDPDKPMSYTWYNLDTIYHGKSGAEHIVTYTVTEKPVKGYTSNVSDTKERYDEVTPEKGDNPKAKGWYVKVGDEYKAATDTAVEKGKTYYEKHFTVTVTNTLGEIPLRGDVIYVDPKNPVGKNAMIVKSTSYRKPEEAKDAAEKRTDAPSDPKHKGVNFVGWDLNWDENGNYVLVAIYSDIPTTVTPVTTYIDPQSGEPVLISEITNDPSSVKVPADPKHNDLQFVGWVKSVDAGGNTIFVAKFKADCANNANATGNGKGINTGEGNELILWVSTMFAAGALLSIHLEMRRRQRSR